MRKASELDERFRIRYGTPIVDASLTVERKVIGADYGANGYSTLAQVDLLAKRLRLRKHDRLLDIGSGRGWPGLYLAASTGCRAVLSDLPDTALRLACARAERDGLADRVAIIRASATAPPFQAKTFDVVTHTDTL